jgi:hypothetical protein
MALAVTVVASTANSSYLGGTLGGLQITTGTLAFDSSYPTGGEAVTESDFSAELGTLVHLSVEPTAVYTHWVYDKTNDKLKGYTATNTEIGNTTDLSALTAVPFTCYWTQ